MALALALRFRSVVGKFETCSGAPAATSIVKKAGLPRPPPASAIFNNLSHHNINQLQQLDYLFGLLADGRFLKLIDNRHTSPKNPRTTTPIDTRVSSKITNQYKFNIVGNTQRAIRSRTIASTTTAKYKESFI
ncbi:hypothetical protein TB1_027871 [Malus domestica]